jgi:signal transduction histidine kinase/CheY-like chemotaxis protein
MLATQADLTVRPADVSRAALECAYQLLGRPAADQPALNGLLAELADAFAAPRAGLANLPEGKLLLCHPPLRGRDPVPVGTPNSLAAEPEGRWPWEGDSTLLTRVRQSPRAVSVARHPGEHFLLTTLVAPDETAWLLWLDDEQRPEWSEADMVALPLVGQVMARWLGAGGQSPRWADQLDRAARQHRLEIAAQVTRRVAHDFGNVLTGILGFTELALAQQVTPNSPLHNHLSEVYRGAQSGAVFTQQLRLFSRRQSASSRSCSLAAVLADEETRLRSAGENGLQVRISLPEELPALALDGEQMRQVLAALLDNSREAMLGGGSISVSARATELSEAECHDLFGSPRPGPSVEICIADTGSGLSPEVQRKLFAEPFFTSKPRRRGFGLAIAYGILHAHHGGLRLHPGSEHGVVARIVVPVAPSGTPGPALSEPVAVPASKPAEKSPAARGDRVLVVHEEPSTLQVICSALERAGHRVQKISGTEEALECLAANQADPFRLVVVDVALPRLRGVELARRLWKREPNLPVLFLTGQGLPDRIKADLANYPHEILTKPFRPEGLLRTVRAVLDRALAVSPVAARSGLANNGVVSTTR